MSGLEHTERLANRAVGSVYRRRFVRGSLAAVLLVISVVAGLLVRQGRQQSAETLAMLNRYGRGEEVLCWPWDLARYRGVPIPNWFPHEIRFADNWDDKHTQEFLEAAGRCSTLRWINTSSQELVDEDFSPLGRLTALEAIEITYAERFTGTGFRHLPQTSSMEKIITELTGITDEGVAQFVRFPGLRELQLLRCQATDDGLATLARLPKLRVLAVSSPHLTSQGVAVLSQSRSLQYLGILWEDPADDNPDPVTAEAVEELQRQMPWCRCSFDGQTWERP